MDMGSLLASVPAQTGQEIPGLWSAFKPRLSTARMTAELGPVFDRPFGVHGCLGFLGVDAAVNVRKHRRHTWILRHEEELLVELWPVFGRQIP